MTRGLKKHLKRLAAPRHWMLDKLSGKWAPKASAGPHKLRECLPLIVLLRNRLKYALSKREVTMILAQRLVKVDGKVRTDPNFPAGFQDVVSIEKTNDLFRLVYDTKGRFALVPLDAEEAKFKLCKVVRHGTGVKGVPYLVTHDGRTIRYPDPLIAVDDTIKLEISSSKVQEIVKFEVGVTVMVTGGRNLGRVGSIVSKERHEGSFDIVHIKDALGRPFATRSVNVFVLGKQKSLVKLPPRQGVKLSVIEEREFREKRSAQKHAE